MTGHSRSNVLMRKHAAGQLCAALVSIVLIGSVAMLATASAAHAGTYVINNCPSAPTPNGDPGPWVIFGSPQSSKASCGSGAGDWIGPRGGSMSPGTSDGVRVTVPAGSGITIREAKVWWYVPQQSSGASTFALAGTNGGIVGESGTPLERRGKPDVFALASSTTSFTLEDYCSNDDAGQGCAFGGGENPNLQLFGSQLTLTDSRLPSGSVTGGGLAGTGALSGIQSIAYSAEDADSGVRLVGLLIDGHPAAQNDYLAQCAYANFAACPASESGSIGWNTATVPDGQHSLELIVQDAAQNTRTIYAGTITTANAPADTSTPAMLAPGPGAAVTAPFASGGAGAPNGTGATQNATIRLVVASSISRPFVHSALKLTGRLLDSQGHPIGDATLDVIQRARDGASAGTISHAHTRADGSFTATVPTGPSRMIVLAYRAFTDAGYGAQANIRESVAAGVQLRIAPRRTTPNGTIILTGKVQGPIPPEGALVDLLVHYRRHWEPFRTTRTDRDGHFKVVYQFEGAVGRFPFRAEVPQGQARFPYGNGYSNVIDVATSG
jgi:hypothetical protein